MFSLFAYLDPSSGSLFIQSIIGVTAVIGIFGRRVISDSVRKVKNSIRGNNKAGAETEE